MFVCANLNIKGSFIVDNWWKTTATWRRRWSEKTQNRDCFGDSWRHLNAIKGRTDFVAHKSMFVKHLCIALTWLPSAEEFAPLQVERIRRIRIRVPSSSLALPH